MQKEGNNISFDNLTTTTTTRMSFSTAPLLFSPTNPLASPTYLSSTTSFYSSLYQSNSSSSSTTSISDTESFDGGDAPIPDILEYQQLYNRYAFCLPQLGDAIDEVDALRRENDALRLSNADLSRRVALLFSRDQLLSEFNRLSVAAPPPIPLPPQPLANYNRIEQQKGGTERVTLPKSISVRSKGYLKMMSRAGQEANRQTASQAGPPPQRVYVPGVKTEEDQALELDVYNQGMFKTELCNKWQETGACHYGENCQFAHGIKELRPVIRHPRYKTEVCRMVLAGDICPYGHRCHFRHSLTEQERLMVGPPPPPPRWSITRNQLC